MVITNTSVPLVAIFVGLSPTCNFSTSFQAATSTTLTLLLMLPFIQLSPSEFAT